MKGYDFESKPQTCSKGQIHSEQREKSRKRNESGIADEVPAKKVPLVEDEATLGKNIDFEYPASLSHADTDTISKIEVATQTDSKSKVKEKRGYFIDQATYVNSCYRHIGLTRSKLDLLPEFLEPKATDIRLWRGSKNTKKSLKKKQPLKPPKTLIMMLS